MANPSSNSGARSLIPASVLAMSLSHILCCGIPAVLSIINLLAGIGLIATIPASMTGLHEILHDIELPMVVVSAALLVFGWAMHLSTYSMRCTSTGCEHPPCPKTKRRNMMLLSAASLLFAVNFCMYLSERL